MGSVYDDIRLHVVRSYNPPSPDNPLSLIYPSPSSHRLSSPLYFHSHRPSSNTVILCSHLMPITFHPPFLNFLLDFPYFRCNFLSRPALQLSIPMVAAFLRPPISFPVPSSLPTSLPCSSERYSSSSSLSHLFAGSLRQTQFSSSQFCHGLYLGSNFSVDTVHPSLLRSSSFSSPTCYHILSLSSDVFLVSPLYVAKQH